MKAYVFGIDGSFAVVECGKGWPARSCMLSACCSLGAGGQASPAREIPEGLRYIVVDTFPSYRKSALGLGHRNREEATLQGLIFAST